MIESQVMTGSLIRNGGLRYDEKSRYDGMTGCMTGSYVMTRNCFTTGSHIMTGRRYDGLSHYDGESL